MKCFTRNNIRQVLQEHADVGAIVGMCAFQGPIMLEFLQQE